MSLSLLFSSCTPLLLVLIQQNKLGSVFSSHFAVFQKMLLTHFMSLVSLHQKTRGFRAYRKKHKKQWHEMGQGLYEGFITFFVALQRTLKIFLTQICSLETKKLTFFS